MKTLQVICPAYNEALVLERFYAALKAVLQGLEDRYAWRVLFVLDRSSDGSLEILRRLAREEPRVSVLALSARFGHQASLVAGMDHADADAIVMMDSDLQHPPELIPRLIASFEAGHEVVYTLRDQPGNRSAAQRLLSFLFYRLMRWLSPLTIEPGAADYRLISRRVAEVFRTRIREHSPFLRGLFAWVGYEREAIPYQVAPRAAGATKYDYRRLIQFALSGIVSFSRRPLKLAVGLGLSFTLLALAYLVFSVIHYFALDHPPEGYTTLAVLICFFGGIQLLFLGLLGEYVGSIFDEVKGRPLYLIEDQINL